MQTIKLLKFHILAIVISLIALSVALSSHVVVVEVSILPMIEQQIEDKLNEKANLLTLNEEVQELTAQQIEEGQPCQVWDWDCRAINGMIPEGTEFPTKYTKTGKETAIVTQCLAVAMWAEARRDGDIGMIGIGHAILNRVDQKGRFGFAKTPCSVVLQHAQFEPLAKGKWEYRIVKAARQGNLSYKPKTDNPIDSNAFKRAKHLARQIMYGGITDPTNGATNFYAPKVLVERGSSVPSWAVVYPLTVKIGGHDYHKAVYFHEVESNDNSGT